MIVKKTKFLLYGALLFFFSNFSINIFVANLMYFFKHTLHYSTWQIGVTLSISGAFATFGSFIAPFLIKRVQESKLIVIMTILAGSFTIFMLFFNNFIMIGIIWGLVLVCGAINVVSYFTLRQKSVDPNYLGGTIAITRLIAYFSIPFASILEGIIVQYISFGMVIVILLSATLRVGTGIGALFTPLFKHGTL